MEFKTLWEQDVKKNRMESDELWEQDVKKNRIESNELWEQDVKPSVECLISRCDAILYMCEKQRTQARYEFQRNSHVDDSYFMRNGINYDYPLTPMEVAERRAERTAREKLRSYVFGTYVIESRHELTESNSGSNNRSRILQSIQSRNDEILGAAKLNWCVCMQNRNEVTPFYCGYGGDSEVRNLNSFDSVLWSSGWNYEPSGSHCYMNSKNFDCVSCVPPLKPSTSTSDTNKSKSTIRIGCCVCFDDVQEISTSARHLMATFCGHIFCNSCINRIIKGNPYCPVCRQKIIKKSVHKIYL